MTKRRNTPKGVRSAKVKTVTTAKMPTAKNAAKAAGKATKPKPKLASVGMPSPSDAAQAADAGRKGNDTHLVYAGIDSSPRKRGRRGHFLSDTHRARAAPDICSDQTGCDDPAIPVAAGEGPYAIAGQKPNALSDLIGLVIERHRQRRALLIAEGDMERRIKSKERGVAVARLHQAGVEIPRSKFPPVEDVDRLIVAQTYPSFFVARDAIAAQRKAVEKDLVAHTRRLPVFAWAKAQRGISELSLAAIVGEAGDLGNYANPGKLWKRMGLAVFDGKSQRRTTDAEKAVQQGYSPARRSQMHVIGENLIRASNPEYRALYDARKAYEVERDPEMKPLHAHRRALRYIEKRLLRSVWQAWRAADEAVSADFPLPPAQDAYSAIQEAAE